jgi:hypothetical protein
MKRKTNHKKAEPSRPKATIDTSGFEADGPIGLEDNRTWDEIKVDELRKLNSEISQKGSVTGSDRAKIASLCLEIHKSTPLERGVIIDKASIFSRFSNLNDDESFSKIFGKAAEISAAPDTLEDKTVEKWQAIGDLLKGYIKQRKQGQG